MNFRPFILTATILLIAIQTSISAPKVSLKTDEERVSYAIGVSIGDNFKRQSVAIKLENIMAGIRDGLSGKKIQMTQTEMQTTMEKFSEKMRAKMSKKSDQQATKNLKDGQNFLKRNKLKKSVKALPSGLQYEILRKGKGVHPKLSDRVEAHYRGTLLNGEEFDSSYSRGKPSTFPLNGVIKGWTEALQLMSVGSKWKLFIPPNLAYGKRGAGAKIGPNATLIFEVELLKIK